MMLCQDVRRQCGCGFLEMVVSLLIVLQLHVQEPGLEKYHTETHNLEVSLKCPL